MVQYSQLNRYQNMRVRVKELSLDGVVVSGRPVIGKDIFVSSTSGNVANNGLTPTAAVLTLEAGINLCTASQGDRVFMLPGHAETISSATALNFDLAGIDIIGLGAGSARPTITLDTGNTTTIPVTAANITISNVLFVANFLSIAACFTIASAKNFQAYNCDFRETSSTLNFLNIFQTTGGANTADGLTVVGCTWEGIGTTSVNSFILTANTIDSAKIISNRVSTVKTTDTSILLTVTAGILTLFDCGDNCVYSKQTATTAGSLISVGGTTSTGWVYRNFAGTLTTTGDKLFTTTVGLFPFENRVTGVLGATGFVIPAVDS